MVFSGKDLDECEATLKTSEKPLEANVSFSFLMLTCSKPMRCTFHWRSSGLDVVVHQQVYLAGGHPEECH